MVIKDSNGGGADVVGTTSGASGVVSQLVVPVVAAHPMVALEVLAYLGLLEVQHRPLNDSICRE
uniref:Uncharacterized protein n=1 Tax=Vitis vinifera TaxID=29760 RepID=A5BTR9_VITVI|nr:hypothetical protein VITISV_013030 [Vitis vinifera]